MSSLENGSKSDGEARVEEAGVISSPITKRQKLARNCKRFWWAWLAGFLLFVLVIVIIVIYGIIPPVAQKVIDDTTLTLHSLKILNPSSDSFEVSLNGTISGATGAAAHARLEAFEVKVFLEGHDPIQPFMTLPVDEIHGGNDVPVVQNNITVDITDDDALDEFALKLMDNDLLRVAMRGKTEMWLGKIHTSINYNEVVTLNALNRLQGMVITSYELLQNQSDANLAGEVMIPNPSVVTIQMGDVGLIISLDGDSLGTGVIPSLTLTPGNNTYGFRSLIDQDKLIPMALAAGQGKPLTIGSNGTMIDGVKIPWLSKPLEGLNSLVPINSTSSS